MSIHFVYMLCLFRESACLCKTGSSVISFWSDVIQARPSFYSNSGFSGKSMVCNGGLEGIHEVEKVETVSMMDVFCTGMTVGKT